MKRKDVDMNHFLQVYHSGATVKQTAETFGINTSTVYDWLKTMGIATKRRKIVDLVALRTMYDAGTSVKNIASECGVSCDVIRSRLKDLGLTTSHRKSIDLAALRDMHDAGISVTEIARNMGVASSVIVDRLSEIGITPRNRSEAMYTRMSHTSTEERRRLTNAAHASVRGVRQTDEHRHKIAVALESSQAMATRTEAIFIEMLNSRGITATPQKAIGRYNVDIALDEFPVIVEINSGGWHGAGAHAARYAERTKYLLDCGLSVVVIWINTTNMPLESSAADYVVSIANKLGSQKPVRGEEIMIRGDGQSTSIGQRKFNNLPAVSCSECRDNVTGRFKTRPFDETIKM